MVDEAFYRKLASVLGRRALRCVFRSRFRLMGGGNEDAVSGYFLRSYLALNEDGLICDMRHFKRPVGNRSELVTTVFTREGVFSPEEHESIY